MGGMHFARFLVQRVIKMAVMVFAIIAANFLLVHAAPGDPASVMAGEAGAADPQFLAQLRTQFGLDQPLSTQLWLYVSHVAHGDLGMSYRQQRPVAGLIAERLSATLLLTGTAFVLAVILGVILGLAFAQNIEAIRQMLQHFTGNDLFSAEIYFLSQLPAKVEPVEVTGIVLMAFAISFMATIYPAWRAARLDPVEALRYE